MTGAGGWGDESMGEGLISKQGDLTLDSSPPPAATQNAEHGSTHL